MNSHHKTAAVVLGVAKKMNAAEDSIDIALADLSRLMIGILEARKELGLPASASAEAYAKVGESITALTEARMLAVQAHEDLHQTAILFDFPVLIPGKERSSGESLRLAG